MSKLTARILLFILWAASWAIVIAFDSPRDGWGAVAYGTAWMLFDMGIVFLGLGTLIYLIIKALE